ncbi:MAG: DUF7091 family protein [Natronomonas sp.]
MSNRRRLRRLLETTFRSAGRQYEEARQAYGAAKRTTRSHLPTDQSGRARIVCRRHAEKVAVNIDDAGRPPCYDPDHPDCRGCIEDIEEGYIETW